MNINKTEKPLSTLGAPNELIVDGLRYNDPRAIASWLSSIAKKPEFIRAIAFSIIGGIVKIYVRSKSGDIVWFD